MIFCLGFTARSEYPAWLAHICRPYAYGGAIDSARLARARRLYSGSENFDYQSARLARVYRLCSGSENLNNFAARLARVYRLDSECSHSQSARLARVYRANSYSENLNSQPARHMAGNRADSDVRKPVNLGKRSARLPCTLGIPAKPEIRRSHAARIRYN